jgi:C4-dicarboxylate-specific signal transduction histidine kinase
VTELVPFGLFFMAAICVLIQQRRLARTRHRLAELERELVERRDQEERCRMVIHEAVEARQWVEKKYAELQRRLNDVERTQTLGNLAAAIAHDFNNALTLITTNCQVARSRLVTGHPAVASIEKIEEVVHFASQMVRQIETSARNEMQPTHALSTSRTSVQSDAPAAPDSANPT